MGDHVKPPKLQELLNLDGYLNPHAGEITRRYQEFVKALDQIEHRCGGLDNFTQSYKQYGFNVLPDNSVHCLEWAPGAEAIALVGDFSTSFRLSINADW